MDQGVSYGRLGARRKVRVLIVDDSALVRQTLTRIFSTDHQIEVIGAAADPYIAARKIRNRTPDVITLDVEMPRMDGLTFLKKIMSQHPIPVVICSALTEQGAESTFRALEYGAVDVITKPRLGSKQYLEESRIRLCDIVKAAACANVRKLLLVPGSRPAQKFSADAVIGKVHSRAMIQTTAKVVVIGASTGGTDAIKQLLEALPPDTPGMVIVQHMPEHFTSAFAKRLNDICRVTVKEAADGDTVRTGRVLIAPGNRHTLLRRSGARYFVEVTDGPLVSRHRPSVDVLFRSAAQFAGGNAVGVILTGMGDDGAQGLLELKDAGGITFAQDKDTSIVFGMPKEAIRLDAVRTILPLQAIAGAVLKAAQA